MATEKAPETLQQAIRYFTDPDVCLKAAIALRWGGGPVQCPMCDSTDVHFIATRRIWRCSQQHERRQFSVKIGTVMEDSPIGLDKWMVAIWLLANARNGISSYELHRAIGVTQKTAWFMLHRVRLAMQAEDGGKFSGEVEADETYIGGKARNMHPAKRKRLMGKKGNPWAGKVAMMGLLERHSGGESQMRTVRIGDTRQHRLHGHIREHVESGTTVYTDALQSYRGLADYEHKVIDHAERYVDGQIHTNGCENFWSLLKRAIRGTYVAVEPFHLFRYLDEECFRFNNRKLTDAERFAYAASTIVGKRLTYRALVGKDMLESRTN
jgi:transposase-like protein